METIIYHVAISVIIAFMNMLVNDIEVEPKRENRVLLYCLLFVALLLGSVALLSVAD